MNTQSIETQRKTKMSEYLKEIFDTAVEDSLDKNETIMRLINEGSLSVLEAVREYQALAKEAGMIASSGQRQDYLNEKLTQEIIHSPSAKKAFVESYVNEFDISLATGNQDIKKWCDAQGIELPTISKNTLEDLKSYVQNALDNDQERVDTIQGLQDDMGYTKNSAASAYSRALRELGITPPSTRTAVDLPELVKFIRENIDEPKKTLAAMIQERFGYAKSSAASFLVYLKFAKEFAKQEVEANS